MLQQFVIPIKSFLIGMVGVAIILGVYFCGSYIYPNNDLKQNITNDNKTKHYKNDEVNNTSASIETYCSHQHRTPQTDKPLSLVQGARFGDFDPMLAYDRQNDSLAKTSYYIDFKSSYPDGLIFMWTRFSYADFEALYLKQGYLHFGFGATSSGAFKRYLLPSYTAYLVSSSTYNDSIWHTASFIRHGTYGELTVDGIVVATGSTSADNGAIYVSGGSTVFIGGIPLYGWEKDARRKLQNMVHPFPGCLKNFIMDNKKVDKPFYSQSVQSCSSLVENKMYFQHNAGYLKLDNLIPCKNFTFSMSIMPRRRRSGILLIVNGNLDDYLFLQMTNCTLDIDYSDKAESTYQKMGPQLSGITPFDKPYHLCDGNWHRIRVDVRKDAVTLVLDNTPWTLKGNIKLSTNKTVYIGGHANPDGVPGLETTEQYIGCIQDVSFDNQKFKIDSSNIQGFVDLRGCPA